ncbi:class I SAM-dependent methyltransferase [Rhodopila sp.]|uniref:class I SAM-dependent methyltransferase n=1 Tax=Rhodopila sp. TaxID=2480087 RepID=UPI002C87467B|nr:methyltransferase domain-containing protein [Rhodopila sp.]HVZ06355.1 methyltransferase domain-containing protein [Rhodopila sp.]
MVTDTTFGRATEAPGGGQAARLDWTVVRRLVGAWLRDRRQFIGGKVARTCPICGHTGAMIGVGHPPRWDSRCARCGSRERHRLLWLWITADGGNRLNGKRILHFAPEKALRKALAGNPGYETCDLFQPGVTHQADITRLPMTDQSYDVIIANHVLEHIDDDCKAMRELFRVLRPGGIALLTVPLNPTRATTYEDPAITDPALRNAHFNAPDHRRYYGLDFADRLSAAGFSVETFRLPPPAEVRYGLLPMEWLYIATRPGQATPAPG